MACAARLKPGDTIAIVAPAGPAVTANIGKYAKRLEKAGYKVVLPQGGDRKSGYLAGTDKQCADELNAALRDSKVRAVMPCRGGYGLTRILDRIDYAALRKDPKIITGFSDLTALHLAAARNCASSRSIRRCRCTTCGMRRSRMPSRPGPSAARSSRRAIRKEKPDTRSHSRTTSPRRSSSWEAREEGGWSAGTCRSICATMGTPYAIEAKGNLLFLEDVHEAPYRIDRMLSQLRLSGALDSVNGVILGGFTTKDPKDAKAIEGVLREYFAKSKVPVLMNFPVGHQAHNATLPHGASAELDADKGTLRLLENPVRLE